MDALSDPQAQSRLNSLAGAASIHNSSSVSSSNYGAYSHQDSSNSENPAFSSSTASSSTVTASLCRTLSRTASNAQNAMGMSSGIGSGAVGAGMGDKSQGADGCPPLSVGKFNQNLNQTFNGKDGSKLDVFFMLSKVGHSKTCKMTLRAFDKFSIVT